jgi:serine/threonine-protein kinase
MPLLHDGQEIDETYRVARVLGEGAFAEVYLVEHLFLGRQAMKVFKAAGMTAPETAQLLDEARQLARIGHPNIVRVFDANVFQHRGERRGYFTMEWVAGGSLERFWQNHGARFVKVTETFEIVRQICRGLAVAHSSRPPIVHRDIKPGNVLIGYDGAGMRIRVSDFGLAKHANPLTQLLSARGTPMYKPPEVFADPANDSTAADVWAVGCTLYLLLTDRLPFDDFTQLARHDLEKLPPTSPPSRFNALVDSALDAITLKALAPRRIDRYADAAQMLAELERWQPPAPRDASAVQANLTAKDALGPRTIESPGAAAESVQLALKLALNPSTLTRAADVMEDALSRAPHLREQYEYHVRMWRRGVTA